MHTEIQVQCRLSDNSVQTITITCTAAPPQAAGLWVPDDPAAWNVSQGKLTSWDLDTIKLGGPGGDPSIVLYGFPPSINVGSKGLGRKNYSGGGAPIGEIKWEILAIHG